MLKSWKTSLIGILTGIGIPVLELVQNGTTSGKTLVLSAAIAAIGLLSKDHNVSGSR